MSDTAVNMPASIRASGNCRLEVGAVFAERKRLVRYDDAVRIRIEILPCLEGHAAEAHLRATALARGARRDRDALRKPKRVLVVVTIVTSADVM